MDFLPMRLKHAMELRDIRQAELVELTGISKGALSSYLSGRYAPKQNSIYLLSKALRINEAWLMGADVPMDNDAKEESQPKYHPIKIPVLGRIVAGIPTEAVEDIIDTEEISEEMARTGEFFGLQIKGDSMEPRIRNNDVIIVRKQEDAESGDTVVVMVNGSDATCKRLRKYKDGIELIATNPSYAPLYFTNEEIQSKPVKIIGKVVELRGKF